MPCTYADTYITNAGVEAPIDIELTPEYERCTRLLLDYILLLEPLADSKSTNDNFAPNLK